MKVKANGISFACKIDGPEGAPWVVFSNSLATDTAMWDEQAAALKSRRIIEESILPPLFKCLVENRPDYEYRGCGRCNACTEHAVCLLDQRHRLVQLDVERRDAVANFSASDPEDLRSFALITPGKFQHPSE